METSRTLLIVRKRPFDDATLKRLLEKLSTDFSLDSYTARMNLTGIGLSLLKRGEEQELEAIGRVLSRFGLKWAVTEQARRIDPPMQVRRFHSGQDGILFEDSAGRAVLISVGARLLVVLAGMNGRIIQRIMRAQQWASADAKALTRADQYKTILSDKPLLDLVVMPPPQDSGLIQAVSHVRITPGHFDPKSLGDQATSSSMKNLDLLMQEVKSVAGKLIVDMDFGISQLPGCIPDFSNERGRELNHKVLNHYCHYALQVHGRYHLYDDGAASEREAEAEKAAVAVAVATGSIDAGLVVGSALTAARQTKESENFELSGISAQEADEMIVASGARTRSELPLPPFREERREQKSVGRNLPVIAVFGLTVLLVMLIGLIAKSDDLVKQGWSATQLAFGQGAAALTVSAVFFWLSTHFFRLKRWVDNTPTSKIRSMAMGMVELAGVAERAYGLVSPVSNVACVWYRIRRYSLDKSSNANQANWRLVSTQDSGTCPFYIRDDTGRVLVDPGDADMRPSHKTTYQGTSLGMMVGSYAISSDEKVVEELIPESQQLYVLGFAQPLTTEPKTLRRRTAERLRELKKDHAALMRYDLDHNGEIDDREWSLAVKHATKAATIEMTHEPAVPDGISADVAVIAPPDGQLPFIVSAEKEYRLTKRYALYSVGGFLLAVISLVIGVARIAKSFGLE